MSENRILFDIETTGLMENLFERILTIAIHDLQTQRDIVFMEIDDKGELDEAKTIQRFFDYIKQYSSLRLIGYNSDSFDVPFIIRRSVVHGLQVPRFESSDLRKVANGFFYSYDRQAKGRLADWAQALGIEVKTENGSHMFEYYKDKKYDLIREHCIEDIQITKKLYFQTKKTGLI